MTGTPAVLYSGGRYDVFAVARSGQLYKLTFTAGKWLPWHDMGGSWAPGLAAVRVGSAYHVFGHRTSGHLQQATYPVAGSWLTQDLGGVTTGAPGVTYSGGRYAVYATTSAGTLLQDTYSGGSWHPWRVVGAAKVNPSGVSAVSASTVTDVFERGTNNALQQDYTSGSSWTHRSIGAGIDTAPAALYAGGNYTVYAEHQGVVYKATYNGKTWSSFSRFS
ncbi:hypothetical protein [Leekyejoonella antrihumi]|uniref:hypothetical protein n=1 Tax=Leekyejoonella antrihumi TaxID=1660198 RepID=UPI001FE6BE22|nr:hypothetical protein [Leekyejoonella antrihumi]